MSSDLIIRSSFLCIAVMSSLHVHGQPSWTWLSLLGDESQVPSFFECFFFFEDLVDFATSDESPWSVMY